MREISVQIKFNEYENVDHLGEKDKQLIMKARDAAKNGYAPYSGFRVGAAVLLANGIFVTGNNQENAAYPSGLCAERTALFYAASQYPNVPIIAITVSAIGQQSFEFAKPCGACRQVIAEYEDLAGHPLRILLDGNERIIVIHGIDGLLPIRFKKQDLNI